MRHVAEGTPEALLGGVGIAALEAVGTDQAFAPGAGVGIVDLEAVGTDQALAPSAGGGHLVGGDTAPEAHHQGHPAEAGDTVEGLLGAHWGLGLRGLGLRGLGLPLVAGRLPWH